MEVGKLDEAFFIARERFLNAVETYREKFGADSLDRVIVHDPEWLDAGNFNRGAEELERAIRRNKPIKQIPEGTWEKMIF